MVGDCSVANYKLHRGSKVGVDHFAVAFTFGIAAMIGIAASSPISGSHLNPAVTVAFAIIKKLPFRKIPHYFLGQYLGAFLAAVTVFFTYQEGITAYDGGERIAYNVENETLNSISTGVIFATYPAPWVTVVGTLIDQIIATFALVFSVMAVTNHKAKLPDYLHPFMLGMVICAMVVAFGLNCGAALNPARDLSPRIFLAISGYGLDAFKPVNSLYWLTAGIIGPHIGAIIGAWSYSYLLHYDDDEDDDDTNRNAYIVNGDDNQISTPVLIKHNKQ
ncbi:aquaporin-10-like protein 2 [Sarcoptes scabiei]|uniref:Aquaporin-10-like protein 2 n=1 Tax=Sarcoptes scabiei TaxID=52283 RepID=A0A132A8E4_SARSC|nr:aquaporin-10-like protein 2 [Sarcoptes scabiei]